MSSNKTGGGEPKGFRGRRRPLKKPLKKATGKKGKMAIEEFYCPACKPNKRVKVNIKNINIKTTKNGRKMAYATATVQGKEVKVHKFISEADAERIKKTKK